MVEDDSDDSDIVREAILTLSPRYSVNCTDQSDKALAYLESLKKEELPALIILDLNLPLVNGIQFLKTVKANKRLRHIPVAIYSNATYKKYKEEALEAGACAYFTKKATVTEIKEDVEKMLTYCNPTL
jgi:CheY-like chemotaxis protein